MRANPPVRQELHAIIIDCLRLSDDSSLNLAEIDTAMQVRGVKVSMTLIERAVRDLEAAGLVIREERVGKGPIVRLPEQAPCPSIVCDDAWPELEPLNDNRRPHRAAFTVQQPATMPRALDHARRVGLDLVLVATGAGLALAVLWAVDLLWRGA